LTKYARNVAIVHQFDQFQAFPFAVEEAKANPKIKFYMESQVRNILGDDSVKQVEIEHLPTGDKTMLSVDGIFIFIGYVAKTQGFEKCVHLNDRGEIIVGTEMQTNVPGVFAAGDSIVKRYRQVTTAVADGTIAALSAIEYLRTN
jgi:thioredoxin reductase (NADPH)